jgi:hypothetical protein
MLRVFIEIVVESVNLPISMPWLYNLPSPGKKEGKFPFCMEDFP